ncbi:MAG: hypothetical protein AAGH38_09965 [Pseudomonadota bacterium]
MKVVYRSIGLSFLFSLMAACGEQKPAASSSVQALMQGEMDEVTDVIWGSAGYIITAEGEQSLYPTTTEGWMRVVNGAKDLAALAEKLKSDEYAYDLDDWVQIADGLVVASSRAEAAALAQDEEQLFAAGGHIYRVCKSCHQLYAPGMAVEE